MGNEDRDAARRRAILNLFVKDNPAFEVCLRNLQDRGLPDNDRITLKLYEGEPLNAQIERYCLNLQSVLFTLSVFPQVKIPDEVLDGFFDMTGALIYVLCHLADYVNDDTNEAVPGLRYTPSELRTCEINMEQKVSALALLKLLRDGST